MAAQHLAVSPMGLDALSAVVDLHRRALPDTLNARCGPAYLTNLYRALLNSDLGVGYVASCNGQVAGFVSGTLDREQLSRDLLRHMDPRQRVRLVAELLRHPWGLVEQAAMARAQRHMARLGHHPALLTIAVEPGFRHEGVGRQLTLALAQGFRQAGLATFHVDTREDNTAARRFYEALGFSFAGTWFGNRFYVLDLPRSHGQGVRSPPRNYIGSPRSRRPLRCIGRSPAPSRRAESETG